MKKLLAIGLCLMFLGCSESPVNESGKHIAERSGTNKFEVCLCPGWKLKFRYIIVDEHEYLIMTEHSGYGLTHSPRCSCTSNLVNTMKAN